MRNHADREGEKEEGTADSPRTQSFECGVNRFAPMGEKEGRKERKKSWASDISGNADFYEEVCRRSDELNGIFKKQERLALAIQYLQELELEFQYFKQYLNEAGRVSAEMKIRRRLKTEKILQLWKECQNFSDAGKTPSFFFKFKSRFIYGISEWSFYTKDIVEIVTLFQLLFYTTKRDELIREI